MDFLRFQQICMGFGILRSVRRFFELFTPRSFPPGRAYQWHAHAVACCLKISYMLGTHINKLCKQS